MRLMHRGLGQNEKVKILALEQKFTGQAYKLEEVFEGCFVVVPSCLRHGLLAKCSYYSCYIYDYCR